MYFYIQYASFTVRSGSLQSRTAQTRGIFPTVLLIYIPTDLHIVRASRCGSTCVEDNNSSGTNAIPLSCVTSRIVVASPREYRLEATDGLHLSVEFVSTLVSGDLSVDLDLPVPAGDTLDKKTTPRVDVLQVCDVATPEVGKRRNVH